jgi:hypothetical protein
MREDDGRAMERGRHTTLTGRLRKREAKMLRGTLSLRAWEGTEMRVTLLLRLW